ncbi:hypothetical protein [Vibrio phage VCPH]|nr:hypothetical protein [Vibrio phage VCPH]
MAKKEIVVVQRAPKVGEKVRMALYTARDQKFPDVYSGKIQRGRKAVQLAITAIYAETERHAKSGKTLYNVLLESGDAVLIELGQKGWNAIR